MKIINITVKGNIAIPDDYNAGAAGGYNNIKLVFTFDVGWSGFDKRITFINAKNEPPTYVLIVNNIAMIPADALITSGIIYFSITGTKYDGDILIEKSPTKREYLLVSQSVADGQPPAPIDPDLYAQLQSEISTETTNRINKDNNLQGLIDNETLERETADNLIIENQNFENIFLADKIESEVLAEIIARQNADNLLVPKTTTVNGHALNGNIDLTKIDVGLGNVDNTSDASKPISVAQQAALSIKVDKVAGKSLIADTEITRLAGITTGATAYTDTMADNRIAAQKNVANGVAGLDPSGIIYPAQLPDLSKIKRYGVRRAINQSSATLERIWDSVGLVANAGVDSQVVVNNFDSIYPFNKIRSCNISIVGGKIQVNAYKGDPTFKTDGTNGQVAVEVPIFYQAPQLPGDGYEYWGVSELPLGGWRVNPDFIGSNGQLLQKIYYGKYNAGLINVAGTDKLFSYAGLPPEVYRSRTSFRTVARATDSLCCLIGLQFHDVLSTLFTVEFATLNSQSIMQGVTSLPYDGTHLSILAETAVNRVVLTNAQAGQYVVGQTIDIGTSLGGRQVAKNRKITSITVYDINNKSIAFDGVAVNTLTTHIVYSVAWFNGATDSVVATSGSIVSNSSGKHPCKYREIENPWGNVWQWLDGVNIINLQSWVCNNPALYADDIFTEPYKVLNYINCNTEGWSKTTGLDERYPHARLPTITGGGSTTYYSDYYYKSDVGNRALLLGGNWAYGSYAGLWFFFANSTALSASVNLGARLSWKP